MSSSRKSSGKKTIRHISVLILFVCLTLIMTWPLMPKMRRHIIGGVGDNYVYVWLIEWFKSAFASGRLPSYHVPLLDYPDGFDLAFTDLPVSMIFIGMPISVWFNSVAGYNAALIASFLLSAWGVYLWVSDTTGSLSAGVVSGIIFSFCAYRMSHIQGHLNLMGTQWLPFYFLFLTRCMAKERLRVRDAVWSALFLGLIAWTSMYYLYMTLVLSVPYVIFFAGAGSFAGFLRRPGVRSGAAVFVLLSVLSVAGALWPYMTLSSGHHLRHVLREVRFWSASVTDYMIPHPDHILWGSWVRRVFGKRLCWVESTLYLGVVPLLLAFRAFFPGRGGMTDRPARRAVTAGCLTAFVLSLGTELHWLGKVVTRHGLEPFRADVVPEGTLFLPGYLFFKYLPHYSGMRVWMRYGVFVEMFVSVLAGMGFAAVIRNRRRFWVVVCVLVSAGAVCLESWVAPFSMSPAEPRPVDVWLAEQPGSGAVVQFPLRELKNSLGAYGVFVHHKPWLGNPFGTFPTPHEERFKAGLRRFPDRKSIRLLKQSGVEWVLVDASKYKHIPILDRYLWRLGLNLRKRFGTLWVFQVRTRTGSGS